MAAEQAENEKQATKKLTEVAFELHLDDSQTKLMAKVVRCEKYIKFTAGEIHAVISENPYAGYYLLEKNFEKLLKALRNKKMASVQVAEKRDAFFQVEVTENAMQATLTLTKAYGGKEVTKEDIEASLNRHGVVEGILEEKIVAAVQAAEGEDIVIARGCEPVHGENTRFECLVKECLFKGPKIDDSGKVDFFDLQEFIIVDEGTQLMQRFPPTEGEAGFDVHGQPIPSKPGDDIPFREEEGIRLCPGNEDIVEAATKGHPVIYPDGVKVDPTLRLARIDLSTGNVKFDGSLYVKGDIADNMTVDVTGNVLCDGVIQKARVKAGGDIMVKNGVIGGAVLQSEDDLVQTYGAHLSAAGDIQARFIDNAHLEAGQVILVREYIRHSLTVAGKKVLLGRQGGKGQLIGGKTSATQQVFAKLMGTQADVHTYVEVGVAPKLRAKYDALSAELATKNQEMSGLITTFGHIRKKKEAGEQLTEKEQKDLLASAKDIKIFLYEIEKINGKRDKLEELMQEAKDAFVEVDKGVYRNLQVKIKDAVFKINETHSGGRFTLAAKRVEFSGRATPNADKAREKGRR